MQELLMLKLRCREMDAPVLISDWSGFAAQNLPKGGKDERVELMRGEVMMTAKIKRRLI